MSKSEIVFQVYGLKLSNPKMAILEWVYRFGYTSKSVVNIFLNRKNGQLVDSLLREGLLVKCETLSGSPKYIYTLSPKGLRQVKSFTHLDHQYREVNGGQISQQLVRHTLYVQLVTAQAMSSGSIDGFASERMLHALQRGVDSKFPDVVWQDAAGVLYAIEVELTEKRGDALMKSICSIIDNLAESHRQYHPRFYIYLTPSALIIDSYQKALNSSRVEEKLGRTLSEFGLLDKDARSKWLENRLTFIKIKEQE